MAIFKQFVYAKQGTEYDFWNGLFDIITGLDEGIRIEDANGNLTTVDAQLEDRTSASQATFYCNFGNGVIYRLGRAYSNNASTDQVFIRDNLGSLAGAWWNGRYMIDDVATRSVFVAYIKSENFVWFGISAFNSNISGINRAATRLKVNGNVYAKSTQNNIPVPTPSNVPNNDTFIGENSSVVFAPFFNFAEEAGKISYINKAVFVNGGARQFETEEIKTCSNVPLWSSIALPDGKNYLAIGTNAMIELDAEEEE